MNFKINSSYIIVLNVLGKTLTYTCQIVSEDELFIKFIDKFGNEYSYNKSCIISFEEKKDGY